MEVMDPSRRPTAVQRGQPWNERQSDPRVESLLCLLLAVTFGRLRGLAEVQAPHLQVRDDIAMSDYLLFAPKPLLFPSLVTNPAELLNPGRRGLWGRHASAFWSMDCTEVGWQVFLLGGCGGVGRRRTSALVTSCLLL